MRKTGRFISALSARFEFGDVMQPWKMKTIDGRLILSFSPQVERAESIQTAFVVRSGFHQPSGLYSGVLKDEQGIEHIIKDYFGLVEHHVTRY